MPAGIFKDRLIFVSILSAAIFNIILWLVVSGKFGWSLEKIPLHFNVVYGIDLLGSARQLYVLPLIGAVLFGLNIWLSAIIYSREKLYVYFLVFASLFIQIVLFVALVLIIAVND